MQENCQLQLCNLTRQVKRVRLEGNECSGGRKRQREWGRKTCLCDYFLTFVLLFSRWHKEDIIWLSPRYFFTHSLDLLHGNRPSLLGGLNEVTYVKNGCRVGSKLFFSKLRKCLRNCGIISHLRLWPSSDRTKTILQILEVKQGTCVDLNSYFKHLWIKFLPKRKG